MIPAVLIEKGWETIRARSFVFFGRENDCMDFLVREVCIYWYIFAIAVVVNGVPLDVWRDFSRSTIDIFKMGY